MGHQVAPASIFVSVQHFLDAEPALSCVGYHKLDVPALESGKAMDHLELVSIFKTLSTALK